MRGIGGGKLVGRSRMSRSYSSSMPRAVPTMIAASSPQNSVSVRARYIGLPWMR